METLHTAYDVKSRDAYDVKSREVDFGVLKEDANTELPFFADAISILREERLIYTPSAGVFGITNSGIDEYNLRRSTDSLF